MFLLLSWKEWAIICWYWSTNKKVSVFPYLYPRGGVWPPVTGGFGGRKNGTRLRSPRLDPYEAKSTIKSIYTAKSSQKTQNFSLKRDFDPISVKVDFRGRGNIIDHCMLMFHTISINDVPKSSLACIEPININKRSIW